MVHEFQRRGTGAAFLAIDDDEVGRDAGFHHGLDDAQKLPRVADTEFESRGLAARQFAQPVNELHEFQGCREGRVASWRNAVLANFNATDGGDFFGHLGRGQHAAMTRLGALAQLHLDHLHLRIRWHWPRSVRPRIRRPDYGSRNSRSRFPR